MPTPASRIASRVGSDCSAKLCGSTGGFRDDAVGRQLVRRGAVLALEVHEAAERDRVERDRSAPQAPEGRDAGREADPELVDRHARPAGQDEVPELVDHDEHHEHREHQDQVDQTIQGVCLRRRSRFRRGIAPAGVRPAELESMPVFRLSPIRATTRIGQSAMKTLPGPQGLDASRPTRAWTGGRVDAPDGSAA